jgi:4-amino-4-deoxy-L-arabinose transferase-like glycosyltransferase
MAGVSDSLRAAEVRPRFALPALLADARVQLGLILLLAAAIRFHGLGAQSLWADEMASIEIARQPLSTLWSGWMVRETNPPLYYSMLHLWMSVFGSSAAGVRSLSAIASVAAIPVTYWIGRDIASKRAGLIAAILATLWCHQIYYGQEARGYIFGVLGALIAVAGLVRISDQVRAPDVPRTGLQTVWPWAAHLFGVMLALYVHTTHVLIPLLANLYVAWLWAFASPRRLKPLVWWTLLYVVVVALWAWWGWITWRQLHMPKSNVAWIVRPSPTQGLTILLNVYGPAGVSLSPSKLRTVLMLMGAPFIGLAALGAGRAKSPFGMMLAVFGVGAPVLLFAISQAVPILMPRTLLWAAFAVILCLACALDSIAGAPMRWAAVTVVAGILVLGWRTYDVREPWGPLTAELAQRTAPGEVVLVAGLGDALYLQYQCETLHCPFRVVDVVSPTDGGNRWAAPLFKGPVVQPQDLAKGLPSGRRFWTVSRWADDPRPATGPLNLKVIGRAKTALPFWMDASEAVRP